MASDLMSTKLMLLHCSTLLNDMIEASYLKENGEKNIPDEPLYKKLEKIKDNYSNLISDMVRRALMKRYFDYEFPFDMIERIIAELQNDQGTVDFKGLRAVLRGYHKNLAEKEKITRQ